MSTRLDNINCVKLRSDGQSAAFAGKKYPDLVVAQNLSQLSASQYSTEESRDEYLKTYWWECLVEGNDKTTMNAIHYFECNICSMNYI